MLELHGFLYKNSKFGQIFSPFVFSLSTLLTSMMRAYPISLACRLASLALQWLSPSEGALSCVTYQFARIDDVQRAIEFV